MLLLEKAGGAYGEREASVVMVVDVVFGCQAL